MSKFVTDRVTVSFAWLNRPDDKFGADTANFNVTIPLTDDISAQLKESVQKLGAKKVNGVYEKDGEKFIKFKNRILVKEGAQTFPCVDSQNNPTRNTAAGGDVVKLLLKPALIQRDSSMSVYLDGVQIIEKNSTYGGSGSGFEAVEGGYVDDAPAVEESTEFTPAAPAEDAPPVVSGDDDDLPF